MTEYINTFTAKEKKHFKRKVSHKKTVCRVFVRVKSTETIKPQTFQTKSISCRAHHAEFLALFDVTKGLLEYLYRTDRWKYRI